MRGLKNLRRAAKERAFKELALPPGFRRIYHGQKLDGLSTLSKGDARLGSPVQDLDPASANFGKFVFMVGYDH